MELLQLVTNLINAIGGSRGNNLGFLFLRKFINGQTECESEKMSSMEGDTLMENNFTLKYECVKNLHVVSVGFKGQFRRILFSEEKEAHSFVKSMTCYTKMRELKYEIQQ